MKLEPILTKIKEKKLIGKREIMSLSNSKNLELFSSFMPRKGEIKNAIGHAVFDIQIYNQSYFKNFNINSNFEKWAALEVSDFDTIPPKMDKITIKEGLYAVFNYKGLNTDTKVFEYIYGVWVPNSKFEIDNRPHFQILGEKYKNNDPSSEEEIWVPIK